MTDPARPLTAAQAAQEAADHRRRLTEIERDYGLPAGGGPARPRSLEDVGGMTKEAIADQLATPDGHAAFQRALTGARDVSTLDLTDPAVMASLTSEEVADNWQQVQAASAKETK